jgi:predicted ribosome quality control (RQC) complex YloA/Tae2 family protein
MSLSELRLHVQELKSLVGAQLQEIETHPHGIALSLYLKGRIWWILDLRMSAPMSLILYELTPWKKKILPKPVSLFLNSHAKNKLLSSVELMEGEGRVFQVKFGLEDQVSILDIHLVPKAVNLTVSAQGKKISWNKPKELGIPPILVESHRDLISLKQEWLDDQEPKSKSHPTAAPGISIEDEFKKILSKKSKAIESIENQLNFDEAGELFKKAQDLKSSGDPAMQEFFEKAKAAQRKRAGTEARLKELKEEVVYLQLQMNSGKWQPPTAQPRKLMKKAEATGRTREIQGFTASKGKSAQDNLALLRAAKAWDLWLHLRDYPGSHLILSLDKGQNVPQDVLHEAAVWLAESSVKSKVKLSGMRLDVLVVECRFVRPIKGDKLGRVNYQNERVFTVIMP